MTARPALTLVSGGGPAVDDRALADYGRDDIGNAERLRARHGADLRRTPGLGVLVFDGQRWRIDDDQAHALRRAQETARAIRKEADAIRAEAEGVEPDRRKSLLARAESHMKWATASANSSRLNAMLAQAWPHLMVTHEEWNARPRLFNVTNGTLELSPEEVTLRKHAREDYITHMAGVAYEPDAEAPEFRAFLDRVLPPSPASDASDVRCVSTADGLDRSLQHFVRRCLGVCLIDSVRDQAMIVFHGGGANGKSTLLNAVSRVLGDYAMTAAVQSLLYNDRQSGSGPSPDIARLAEKPRLVRVSEPEPGARLSEGGVKSMTGGEPIVARKLQEAPIEFSPNFKIVLSCNNRPSIRGGDDGIWRRILLVPWKVQIPAEEQREKGPALEAALEREAPGILNWLLDGLADYFERGGLSPPDEVQEETLAYRTDSDVIGRFIAECCTKAEGARTEFGELYDGFKLWSRDEGMKEPLSSNMVGRRLTDRGFGREKSDGFVYRTGLELLPEWQLMVRTGQQKKKDKEAAGADYAAAKDGGGE
ncbi:MAG TPA: phage/plasmid primase, P4 family [Vitreimonas sp.]|uniref:DNA primase family protein n=1 Tax=Vitreimonas sp. TaxID=3069702 RepID=UPI002D6BFB07|nr:phage/plasmid primase, P4 family [Vitreimonas sp.]HYD87128.1 phage/plasmid primase, P4 family [Vitreimonas sp.]